MKQLQIFVSLILVCALLFSTACRSDDGGAETVTSGRFMEVEITPPIDGNFISLVANDGALVAFDDGLSTKYTSTDGGRSWTQTPGPGRGTEQFLVMQNAAFLPDDNLLVFIPGEGMTIVSPDGGTSHFPVEEIDNAISDGENVSVTLIEVLGNDRLLLSYTIGGFGMATMPGGAGSRALQSRFEHATDAQDENDLENGEFTFDGVHDEMVFDGETNSEFSFEGVHDAMADLDDESDNEDSVAPGRRVQQHQISGEVSADFFSPIRMEQHTTLLDISTGAVITELLIEGASSAAADENYFFLLDREGTVHGFNLNDGSRINRAAVSLAAGGGMGFGGMMILGMGNGNLMDTNSDGEIFAAHNNSIHHLANDSAEILLDGNSFSFGAPNSSISGVKILPDGSIIVVTTEGFTSSRMFKYYWDENAVINPQRTLTVWSLENNDFVRAAITELRRLYPDAYITYEVALSGDGAVSASDAIRTLNTRLLSFRGPDIIILDGTPMDNYVNRGMLLDLADSINTNDIFQNLLAPYIQAGGGIYALPMQFRMPTLAGSPQTLTETRTLDALVNRIVSGNPPTGMTAERMLGGIPEEERAELHFDTLRELYDILWLTNVPAVINENRLDSDALRQFLEAMQAISDKFGLGVPPQHGAMLAFGMAIAGGGNRAAMLPSSLMNFVTQTTNMAAFSADNLMIMQMLSNREGAELATFPSLSAGVWQPSTIVSVSADTQVTDFAIEFINVMLSENVQRINYGEGLPITHTGLSTQIQDLSDRQVELGGNPFEFDLDSVIKQLQTPAMVETALSEIIWGTVERLCSGTIDLEGAVREVEQNIRNYLAERS